MTIRDYIRDRFEKGHIMSVKINKELCIGCGTCVSLCDKVFELSEEGKSQVKEGADLGKNADCIEQAATSCPVQAIEVEK